MFDLILIDFSWLYNRYYYIAKVKPIQGASTKEVQEELQHMLLQFFSVVHRAYPVAKIVLALDPPTSSLINSTIFEGYKKNRNKEEKKEVYACFKEIVLSLSETLPPAFTFIRTHEYEADQVIAYLAAKYFESKQILVYSGDKDLLQLSSYTNVYLSDKFEKGKFLVKTDLEIFSKFKNSKGDDFTRISTNKRDILKYRTLKGDASDNLGPVFPRIKDKEIISIIKNYWVTDNDLSEPIIEDIIDNIRGDNAVLAEKLLNAKDIWLRNYRIMNLLSVPEIKLKRVRRNGE